MPERTIGLDINSDSITAVQLTSHLKGYRVTACGHVAIEEDGGFEAGLEALAEQMELKADHCNGALPGEQVSYRNLRMPFKDNKKIRQTLAFELEAIVPFPVEDLIVDFIKVEDAEQSQVLAASVKRTLISEHLSQLQTAGLDPAVLDVTGAPTVSWLLAQKETPEEGLFLDIGRRWNTMILYLKRRIAVIRTFSFDGRAPAATASDETDVGDGNPEEDVQIESRIEAFCTNVRNTVHAFSSQVHEASPQQVFLTGSGSLHPDVDNLISRFLELPVTQLNLASDARIEVAEDISEAWKPAFMNNALALAMRDGKQAVGFNFRRDEFEANKRYFQHKKEIGKVAAFLLVILCLLSISFGVDYYSLKKHYKQVDQQIVEIFSRAFPDVKRVVDPVQQMRVKINEMKKAASSVAGVASKGLVLDLLKDISQRVPESADVDMARIVMDPDTVLMKGETDTFNTVDSIKKGLEPSPYFGAVDISSANLDKKSNRVKFEIKLKRVEQ